MKQLELEMTHQRIKYNAQIAETEANIKQLQRTHEREVQYVVCKINNLRIRT